MVGLPVRPDGVPATKLKHIADMASTLDAGDMKDFVQAKRHTFILALIRQMRISARDDIAEMFIRRIGTMHKSAREELQVIQARQREMSEELVATLEHVVEILGERLDDPSTGQRVRELLAPHGDLEKLRADPAGSCPPFRILRAPLFRHEDTARYCCRPKKLYYRIFY